MRDLFGTYPPSASPWLKSSLRSAMRSGLLSAALAMLSLTAANAQEAAEQGNQPGLAEVVTLQRRKAAEISDGLVAHPVKVERMERLLEIVQRSALARAQRFLGRTVEVLVEGASRTDPERMRGRTRHNKVVNFSGLAGPGELTDVEITAATSQTLSGEERLLTRAGHTARG